MIEKDGAVFWLKQIKDKYIKGGDEEFDCCRKEAVDMAIEALKEYKTGKWIVQSSPFYKDTTIYICPFCKSRYERNSWAVPKFCQGCGMKSIGTDETHKYAGWEKIYEDYPNCGAKTEDEEIGKDILTAMQESADAVRNSPHYDFSCVTELFGKEEDE